MIKQIGTRKTKKYIKGTGWYATDFKDKGTKDEGQKDEGKKEEGKKGGEKKDPGIDIECLKAVK